MTDVSANTPTLVAAVRLAPGGLHFGHSFGSLVPMLDFPPSSRCIFVIKDTEPYLWPTAAEKQEALIEMCSDLLATSVADRIRVTTYSRVLQNCSRLTNCILDTVTFNSVMKRHFRKEELRKGALSPPVRNFLFPVDEANVLAALGADWFLSNDDNTRILRFTRDVIGAVGRRYAIDCMPLPQLHHNRLGGRLIGIDYRRMCKGNANVIRISETERILKDKCAAACSVKRYLESDPPAFEQYKRSPTTFTPGEGYLPFYYSRMLCDKPLSPEACREHTRAGSSHVLATLFQSLNRIVDPIRSRKAQLLSDRAALFRRLAEDTAAVVEEVKRVDEMFADGIPDTG